MAITSKYKNLRWHDLRHAWASWHVQNGRVTTTWRGKFQYVLRYAHLSSRHLKDAASRIYVTNSLHQKGIQPTTSTNHGCQVLTSYLLL